MRDYFLFIVIFLIALCLSAHAGTDSKCLFQELASFKGGTEESVVRNPHPLDVLNWIMVITSQSRVFLLETMQPSLDAHRYLIETSKALEPPLKKDQEEIIPYIYAGGEMLGDYSVLNDLAGHFHDNKLPNHVTEAARLIAQSFLKSRLNGEIEVRYYADGHTQHLHPKIKPRGAPGDFSSMYHEAARYSGVVLGYYELREKFADNAAIQNQINAEIAGGLLSRNQIEDFMSFLYLKARTVDGKDVLPPGLQKTMDLLVRLQNHEHLSEAELDLFFRDMKVISDGFKTPPVEIHYLGRNTMDADGKLQLMPARPPRSERKDPGISGG